MKKTTLQSMAKSCFHPQTDSQFKPNLDLKILHECKVSSFQAQPKKKAMKHQAPIAIDVRNNS
jgi:hypothetical protein